MKGTFSIKPKKTPYQRHKELEEERKRKADEEAAKVYEEFVESFKSDETDERGGVKTFVRGGTVAPGSRSTEAVGNKGSKYVPSFVPPALAASAAAKRPEPGRVQARHDAFADDEEEEDESVFKLPAKKQDKDKPRQIDKMLEQLKREQEEREERERLIKEGKPLPPELALSRDDEYSEHGGRGGGRWADQPFGSHDEGDPYTTNLYVGNIHPDVNEAHLAREFGRFGPIGSVKIMWPRDEEQRRRGRNCGFVAFMTRPDAEKALKALDGLVLHGMEMKIGWGKAVPLPPVPLYSGHGVPTGPLTAIVPPAVTRDRGNPLTLAMQSALVPAQGMFAKESTQSRTVVKGAGQDIEVKIPDDAQQRFIIDSMALYVLKDGCEFEQMIMMEQQGRPDFEFLFNLDSDEHVYYRWRLYSLAEGDTLRTWRIDPYLMVERGQAWLPPPMLAADIAAGTKRKETTRGQTVVLLTDHERDKLEDMLRGLTAERSAIAEAMLFALDNADAAADVVEVLEEALTLPETPPATKLARLFLVNDILHNSTAPVRNASRYRARLEAVLPEIFVSFNATYRAADSRLIQEALKRAVLRLLRVWRERFIFNDDYINGLQATMLGHIPTIEAAEEEEILQQQAAAAAASAAENQTGSPVAAEAAPKARSRWETEEEEEEQRKQQQQQQPRQQQQHTRDSGPTRAQLKEFNPELLQDLEAMTDEELERRCRVNGLSNKGSRQLCVERILALDYYLNAEHRSAGGLGSVAVARGGSLSGGSGLAAAPPAAGSSKWEAAAPAAAADASDAEAGSSRWGGRISLNLKTEQVEAPAGLLGLGLYTDDELQPQAVAIKAEPGAATPPGVAAPAAVAAAANRWQEVDEEAEKEAQPQIPISKWLLEEAEAKRKADEEAAAAAAAAREAAAVAAAREAAARSVIAASSAAPAAADAAAGVGGSAAGAAAAAARTPEGAADDERRKRLRQIEVQVLDHQDELQEKGLSEAEAAAAAAELRQQLVTQLDAELAAKAAEQQSRAESSKPGREKSSGSRGDRVGERDKDRDGEKERGRERERDKERDRDSRGGRSERKRSRSRSRSHSRGRSSRGDEKGSSKAAEARRGSDRPAVDKDKEPASRKHSSSNKDRDRDREKEKEKDKETNREREREKDRSSKRSRGRSSSRSRSRGRSRSGSRERLPLRRGGGGRSRSRSREREKDRDRRTGGSSKRHRSR